MSRRRSPRSLLAACAAATLAAVACPAAADEPVAPPPKAKSELDAAVDEIIVSTQGDAGVPVVKLKETGAHDVLGPGRIAEIPPWSVDEIVNRLPGVNSRIYSGDENLRPSFGARGAPDNGFTEFIGVNVDGINYSTLIYGWTAISIFPFTPERTYAAEVFRGAHSIRYGPTTLGGVVNLITKPIPARWTVGERLVFGSNKFHSSTFDIGGTHEDSGLGFLLTRVDKRGDTFRVDNDFGVRDTSLKLAYPLGPNTTLEASLSRWRDQHELPVRLTEAEFEADPEQNPTHPDADWTGHAEMYDAKLRHVFSDDAWISVQGYYRKTVRSLKSGRPTGRAPFVAIRDGYSDSYNAGVEVRGEVAFDLGTRHVVNWGARRHSEWIYRTSSDDPLGSGPTVMLLETDHDLIANAVWFDDTVEFGDLTLNGGLRYEQIPRYHGEDDVSGGERDFDFDDVFLGTSASYKVTPHVALFANYHQTFRAPQTFSFDFTGLEQEMSFEHGDMREFGARVENWNGVSGSAVLWSSRYSNFIEFDDLTDTFQNLGRYEMDGFDLSAEMQLGEVCEELAGLSVFHSQTWQVAKFRSGDFDDNDVHHVAPMTCKGGVRYTHARSGLYGGMEYNYRSKAKATADNLEVTPSYTLWDARVGWRHRIHDLADGGGVDLDIGFGVKNVFDREHHLRHNATFFVPGRPREYYVDMGVSVEF